MLVVHSLWSKPGYFGSVEIAGEHYLVDHAVPGVACVVDDDVEFTAAEVCGLLDERVEVFVVEHVSWSSNRLATVLVDGVCDALCFFYSNVSANNTATGCVPRAISPHSP